MSLALKLMLFSFLISLVMANNLQGPNRVEKVYENERLRRSPVDGVPEYPSAGYPGYPGSPGGHGPPSNLGEPFKPPTSNQPPSITENERPRRSPVAAAGGSPNNSPLPNPNPNEPPRRNQNTPIQPTENERLRRSPGGAVLPGPPNNSPLSNPNPNEPPVPPPRNQNTPIPPNENERFRRSPVEGTPEHPSAGYPGYPGSPGGHGPPSNLGEPFKPPTSNEQQPVGVPTRIQNTPIPPTGPLDLTDQGGSPADCKVSSNGGFIVC